MARAQKVGRRSVSEGRGACGGQSATSRPHLFTAQVSADQYESAGRLRPQLSSRFSASHAEELKR